MQLFLFISGLAFSFYSHWWAMQWVVPGSVKLRQIVFLWAATSGFGALMGCIVAAVVISNGIYSNNIAFIFALLPTLGAHFYLIRRLFLVDSRLPSHLTNIPERKAFVAIFLTSIFSFLFPILAFCAAGFGLLLVGLAINLIFS